ncbi:MAG TPA: flagellar motor protein MotD [Noviherbaspirillum sp.]|nr:flagellar motor protein MotD [Noviherbaspirillum sp.]
MARKKYEEEPENHERWLVSYADFITLLFAFFVVMYALSSLNEGKYRALSSSLGSAFGKVPVAPLSGESAYVVPAVQQRTVTALQREREKLTGVASKLRRVLATLVKQGKVRVTQNSLGVALEINDNVLFAPGEAKLTEETGSVLKAVAAILKNSDHAIQVEGHTDSVPINNTFFPSNWELSSVRASSVVRLFVESGIAESRLTAIGRSATQPIGDNNTAEGRLRNRRVAVMILSGSQDAMKEPPVEAAPIKRMD